MFFLKRRDLYAHRTKCVVSILCLFVLLKLKPCKLSFYKMVDHNIYVGKTNKLEGNFNYQAWKIKARTIYKLKNIWEVLSKKINIATFIVIVKGAHITKN